MKPAREMPEDLDFQGRKKWEELVGSCDPGVDGEMLANYCRQHSTLLAIRREKRRQQKSGKFRTMVPGRDGTQVLNPLLVTENRLIASLNKTLQALELMSSRGETKGKRPLPSSSRPPGMHGEEPPWGWAIEEKLCG